jgi:long-chain acyl-CoA synthetase
MNGSQIEITKDLTIPKLFLSQCRKYGKSKVAMREKEFGIWRPFTWQDYYDNVKFLSSAWSAWGSSGATRWP